MRKSLLLALSLFGLFISTYLWWVYTSPSHPLVCLGTGCDVVRLSRYANLWGLPVPVFGAAMYLTLALLMFAEALGGAQPVGKARYAVAAISGAGFVFSLYLTGLEGFVIHAWCAWCVASAFTITFIFILAISELARPSPAPTQAAALTTLRSHFSILLIAVMLGAPAFYYLSRHGEMPPDIKASAEALREHLIRADSHMMGKPDATVTVVEFGDFECPACGREEPVVREVLQKYGDRIRFYFRQFPLEKVHEYALKAAEASECAADQGKFWQAEQKFYDNQFDLRESELDRYAGDLSLDVSRFTACLSSGSAEARVRRDIADGRALGVNATPTFFVGDQKFIGPIEISQFYDAIDRELLNRTVSATGAMPPGSKPGGDSSSSAAGSPGLLPGPASNAFSSLQDPGTACSNDDANKEQPDLIRTAEARQLFESSPKPLFVDVRTANEFARGHIPAAINLPVDEFARHWETLPRDRTIVLYEGGSSSGDNICAAGRAAGRILLAHDFPRRQVKVYQDGVAAWEKSGLPVQR